MMPKVIEYTKNPLEFVEVLSGPKGPRGATGATGPAGSVNIDGGEPATIFGGISPLDGGEI
jgi:hypothetical protein